MTLVRAVYDKDWDLLKIQHEEAFRAVASISDPCYLVKYDPTTTTQDDVFNETTQSNFLPQTLVPAIVDVQVSEETMKKFGIVEKPDIMVYFSTVILESRGLSVDNRDRIKHRDIAYEIRSIVIPENMGGHPLEMVIACRTVE